MLSYELYRKSKLQFRPASVNPATDSIAPVSVNSDDDLYIAEDITDDLYNTDYLGTLLLGLGLNVANLYFRVH